MTDCTFGAHTGERYYYNVKVLDTDGSPLIGAFVLADIPYLENSQLEELGASLETNDIIEGVLGISNESGMATARVFRLGCEPGPTRRLFDINTTNYENPIPTSVLVYKDGYSPILLDSRHPWVFSKVGFEFISNSTTVKMNANK